MLSPVRFALLYVALLLATAVGAWAQFGVPLDHTDPKLEPVTVRELVSRYCRLDYAGARLNTSEWPKIQPIVAWSTNPDFPLFMVTLRFDVDSEPTPDRGKYFVMVHYRLLGKYNMAEGYSQDLASPVEDVQYVVSQVNGDWRISEAEPSYPHPSQAAALQWLRKKLAATQDPAARTIYQNAIEQLQSQKASPFAH